MHTIRRAQHSDAEFVGDLWQQLLTGQGKIDPRFKLADDALQRWHNDFRVWVDSDNHRVFVAESDGELIGFLTAHLWVGPPIYEPGLEVFIDEIYVVEEHRRSGVGTALVASARDWADERHVRRLRVGVLYSNKEGIAFWQKNAWQPFYVTLTQETGDHPAAAEAKKGRLGF